MSASSSASTPRPTPGTSTRRWTASRRPNAPSSSSSPSTSSASPKWQRHWGAAAAAAAAVVFLQAGSPAYAVDRASDGTVTVTIKKADDASGLQKALHAKGVNAYVDYLPVGKTCAPGRFTSVQGPVKSQGSVRIQDDELTFSITSDTLTTDASLVIEATADGDLSTLQIAFADGAVRPCTQVDGSLAPKGQPGPGKAGPSDGPSLQGATSGTQEYGFVNQNKGLPTPAS